MWKKEDLEHAYQNWEDLINRTKYNENKYGENSLRKINGITNE